MKLKTIFILATLSVLAYGSAQAQPPQYTVTFIPGDVLFELPTPAGFNNLGEFVSTCYFSEDIIHACLYSNGIITDLGTLGGSSSAAGINDIGQIVGDSDRGAFLYFEGKMTSIGAFMPLSINNKEQIVGTNINNKVATAIIVWQGKTTAITSGGATKINNNYGVDEIGQVIGESELGGFLYSDGVLDYVGFNICPDATFNLCFDISDSGLVTIYCAYYYSYTNHSAYIYDSKTKQYSPIGETGHDVIPQSINEVGDVVGIDYGYSSAIPFIFTQGKMYNINDFIPSNYNIEIEYKEATLFINNQGQILAPSSQGWVVLTPETGPSTPSARPSPPTNTSSSIKLSSLMTPSAQLSPSPRPSVRRPRYILYIISIAPIEEMRDINNLGEIVGSFTQGNQRGFLYVDDIFTPLGTLGGSMSVATAINDNSQIAGFSTIATGEVHAFLRYANGTMIDLGTLSGQTGTSEALSLNDSEQVVGQSSTTASNVVNAVLFLKGEIMDIGTSSGIVGNSTANAINNVIGASGLGQIVGQANFANSQQAFLYNEKKMVNIGSKICSNNYESSTAVSINNVGQVVGNCYNGDSSLGFLYNIESGGHSFIGTEGSRVMDINDKGEMVGVMLMSNNSVLYPFLYKDGVDYNIYDIVSSAEGITGLVPVAVNNNGQIAANSDQGGLLLELEN